MLFGGRADKSLTKWQKSHTGGGKPTSTYKKHWLFSGFIRISQLASFALPSFLTLWACSSFTASNDNMNITNAAHSKLIDCFSLFQMLTSGCHCRAGTIIITSVECNAPRPHSEGITEAPLSQRAWARFQVQVHEKGGSPAYRTDQHRTLFYQSGKWIQIWCYSTTDTIISSPWATVGQSEKRRPEETLKLSIKEKLHTSTT